MAIDNLTDTLRNAIIHGDFMPNERLIEERLVEAFGASRSEIRVALIRLEHEDLVTREKNRGAQVRSVSEAEAIEIAQVRVALEVLVARQAASKVTSAQRNALSALIQKMDAAYHANDLIAYSTINGELHAKIRDIAGHGVATRILSNLKSRIVHFQYRSILLPNRSRHSLAEHKAIVDAICAGDSDAAENAMRTHLEAVATALANAIQRTKPSALSRST
jgi:DNA-binding GntR family transcriptional regulator